MVAYTPASAMPRPAQGTGELHHCCCMYFAEVKVQRSANDGEVVAWRAAEAAPALWVHSSLRDRYLQCRTVATLGSSDSIARLVPMLLHHVSMDPCMGPCTFVASTSSACSCWHKTMLASCGVVLNLIRFAADFWSFYCAAVCNMPGRRVCLAVLDRDKLLLPNSTPYPRL